MFQKTVNRQYTVGFPGDIVRDGPMRARPARVDDPVNPASLNVVSRAFGWVGDQPPLGNPNGVVDYQSLDGRVVVGGANFFGILGHPKHYTLHGTAAGGTLAASLALQNGEVGEFFDMVTGMVVELFNYLETPQTVVNGAALGYVLNSHGPTENANDVPVGGLVFVPDPANVPAGVKLIPNAKIVQNVSLAASAPDAPVSTYAIVQLTQ